MTCGAEDLIEPPVAGDKNWEVSSGAEGARTKNDEIDCNAEVDNGLNLGMYNCRCIGLQNVSGIMSPAIVDPTSGTGTTVEYTASIGSSCAVWDMSANPLCLGGKNDPAWCGKVDTEQWCFVDPCQCGIPIPPEPAVMAPSIGIGNRPIAYSRATCQPFNRDLWADASEHTSCLRYLTKGTCEQAPIGSCVWLVTDKSEGVCVEQNRKTCPVQQLKQMVPASGTSTRDQAPCPEQICPDGLGLKTKAQTGEMKCEATPCTLTDIDTCCAPSATCDTFNDCGDKGVLRENADQLLCRRSVCSFDLDYGSCCLDRAPCTDFPQNKCPMGYRRLKDFESMTCEKTTCDPESDFVRCCEEDQQLVGWGLFGMAVIALCMGSCLSYMLIQTHKKASLKLEEAKKRAHETREDTADGKVYSWPQFQARYKGKMTIEAIQKKFNDCPQVMGEGDAVVVLQSHTRRRLVQYELAPFKVPRQSGGREIKFSEYREHNPGMEMEECQQAYLQLPPVAGHEGELERANELRATALTAAVKQKEEQEKKDAAQKEEFMKRAEERQKTAAARREAAPQASQGDAPAKSVSVPTLEAGDHEDDAVSPAAGAAP